MATLLHVFAHPSPEGSTTMRIADAFVESYRKAHPNDTVDTLDLYREGMPHLTAAHLAAIGSGEHHELAPAVSAAWDEIKAVLERVLRADGLLVTAPMWNFCVPSIMAAFVDHVVVPGYTFCFTGPGSSSGMMTGRPLAIVSTRGGIFSQPPMNRYEMCVSYLRHVFEFLGFNTRAELIAEGLALVAPHEQEEIIQPVVMRAIEVARTFHREEPMQKAA